MPPPASDQPPLSDDSLLRDVPLLDGHKFLDPVVLTARVGRGGWGAVYRGRHRALGIDVAVKCIHPHIAASVPNASERFQREARLTARLSHQNLVRLYEYRQAHGLTYLVLEYVDGETARQRVRRKGPLSEVAAARVILAAARGLAVAHRNAEVIVHRDIKPDNILISRRGEVKLADLGLAKAVDRLDASTFATDGSVGTPRYMAPEQWNSDLRPTPRTDVWALGATLYFLLVGEDMLRGTSVSEICGEAQRGKYADPKELMPELSAEIVRIVQRCTSAEAMGRPADAVEVARVLQEFLGARTSRLSSAKRLLARPGRQSVLISAALVGLASVALWRFGGSNDSDDVHAGNNVMRPPLGYSIGVVDPQTHLRVPDLGWDVVEPRAGMKDWAARVREPKSGIEFALIAPGRFQMGSPADESGRDSNESQHWVTLTRPYYLAVHELTNEQFERVRTGTNVRVEHPDLPIALDREEALAFLDEIDCDLPTEAEWEYAARAGATSRYPWGDDAAGGTGTCNVLDRSAMNRNEDHETAAFPFVDGHADFAPVGSFPANPFGLHDMTGNLWEWCLDGYVERYDALPEHDPWSMPLGNPLGVLRGGSWLSDPAEARLARRIQQPPSKRHDEFGCRAVKRVE